jgi:plastocyanin
MLAMLIVLPLIKGNAQTNDKKFSEGTLYIKIKSNIALSVSNNKGKTDPNDIYFLQKFVNNYQITAVEFPFISTKSDILQRTMKIEFKDVENTISLINNLKNIKEIEYVEQAPIYRTASYSEPDDPYFNKEVTGSYLSNSLGTTNTSWFLNLIHAPEAWVLTDGGQDVTVAVLDNAFFTTHPDLTNKIISTYNLSDLQIISNDVEPILPTYAWSHGTQMAGIIAAETNNGTGIASVGNEHVKLMAIKLGNDIGQADEILNLPEGIIYAVDNGAKVINISMATTVWSETLLQAVNYATNKGCVIIAAAGNNESSEKCYPAAFPNVIAVGSCNSNDTRSSFSNFGDWIDIYAPGGYSTTGYQNSLGRFSILTTSANTAGTINDILNGDSGGAGSYSIAGTGLTGNYDIIWGTSAATAVVSGVCGLILSVNPDLTTNQVKQILIQSADGTNAGIRVNALNAVQMSSTSALTDSLTANFEADITSINLGETVTFTNTSIGHYTNVEWTFEGGNPSTSTDASPSVTYNIRGQFDVTLKLINIDPTPIIKDTSKIMKDSTLTVITTPILDENNTQIGETIDSIWNVTADTLTRTDTIYNILNETTEIKSKLILVGTQVENMNELAISALREQLLNLNNGYSVLKIEPINRDTVLALSYNDIEYSLSTTFNAGTTWISSLITIPDIDTIFDFTATSNEDIMILASTDTGNQIGLYLSNDAGVTWTYNISAFPGFIGDFKKIQMLSDSIGICIGQEETTNYTKIYRTTNAGINWVLINVTDTVTNNPYLDGITSNIFTNNSITAFGTVAGRIFTSTDLGETWDHSIIFDTTENYYVKSVSFANAKKIAGNVLQGLVLLRTENKTKLLKTINGTTWTNVNINTFNGNIEDICINPTNETIKPNNNNNANEYVAIVTDTITYKIKTMYSRNGGTAWQIVDSAILYTNIALYDFHRGWFGGKTSDFSGGIYKWFDVPEIISHKVEIYERDTLGFVNNDFLKLPKEHFYIKTIEPDNRNTVILQKNFGSMFRFYYTTEGQQNSAEIRGISIPINNLQRAIYTQTIEAHNGVRYNSQLDSIIVKTRRHPFIFIHENGNPVISNTIDTTINTHQVFQYTVRIYDTDYDAYHAPMGITGENIQFNCILPPSGGSPNYSWLSFTDNYDTTANYKTATLFGTAANPREETIYVKCTDGLFTDTLKIVIHVLIGLETNELDNINIYPNPTTDNIYITNAEGMKYDIIDITGKIVLSNSIINSEETINIENLRTGSYFIKFYGNNKISTKKIMKL